jgi:hypothetical protein
MTGDPMADRTRAPGVPDVACSRDRSHVANVYEAGVRAQGRLRKTIEIKAVACLARYWLSLCTAPVRAILSKEVT